MRDDTGQLKDDLQQLLSEFENLVKAARGAIGEQSADVAEQVRECLDSAWDRLASLEKRIGGELKAGARVVDGYLRDNTWAALAVAAAAAFVVGVLVTRRK
jgi:ElaB/YqjD/DUF883 family membrane-anchored ribosome-binding protein